MSVRIVTGDVFEVLPSLEREGVRAQTCVTSPPYWGLRDYQVAGQLGLEPRLDCLGWATHARCAQCYVCHMVQVFRLVRSLLAEDGTLWLNLGDCYANGDKGGYQNERTRDDSLQASNLASDFIGAPNRQPQPGLKPKDLCGASWRVALALQADGWWLRSAIPWVKRNAMPESVTDRPTSAVDTIFLLTRSERYYYDAKAVTKAASPDTTHERYARGRSRNHKYADGGPGGQTLLATFEPMRTPQATARRNSPVAGWTDGPGAHSAIAHNQPREGTRKSAAAGRGIKNNRSFDAAMAVMPEARARRTSDWFFESWQGLLGDEDGAPLAMVVNVQGFDGAHFATFPPRMVEPCILAGSRPGDLVLDPFCGACTTALVADRLQREALGVELNPDYAEMGRARGARCAAVRGGNNMNPQAPLYPGQVVQLSPFEASAGFGGCFMIVAEVRAWGATGVVLGPGVRAPEEFAYRATWEQMELIGQAHWHTDPVTGRIVERLEEPKSWRALSASNLCSR